MHPGGNKLHLDSELLDLLHDRSLEVHGEGVQEEDQRDPRGRGDDVGREDLVDPLHHDCLVEPCLFLAGVDEVRVGRVGSSLFAMCPSGVPGKRCEEETIR